MSKQHTLTITSTIKALRKDIKAHKANSKTIALVPTMGALHQGHLSLIEFAKQRADIIICSIFVNPKQFGQNEDLSNYPRPLQDDIDALESIGANIAFTPHVTEIYPIGFQTSISVKDLSLGLCGGSRPGHFDGVATIVSKLLLICQPDIAVFGEKDFQQLLVIKRMVQDINIETQILGSPIIRETDGLALSSRNQYLSVQERKIAPHLYATLQQLAQTLKQGASIAKHLKQAKKKLIGHGFEIDYLELRHNEDLTPITDLSQPSSDSARLFAAVKLGQTRLIDNIPIERKQ